MKTRAWRLAALILFLLTTTVGTLFGDRLLSLSDTARDNLKVYTELLELAHENYGAEVTYRNLVYSSIQGMLRGLDPHTNFLPPEAYEKMREKQAASFYGLGILVGMRNGRLTVITPIEGTPASQRGLRAGDVIDTIEGVPTKTMSLDEAVAQLKGPKDTEVTITLLRGGMTEPIEVKIIRGEIPLTTVRYPYMVDERTGYFRITDFSRSTGQEVADTIASLKAQGMEQLILDLRNNGGGLLDQAIEVADQFVPSDARIVETRGRVDDSNHEYRAEGLHDPLGLPVVVLVNAGSASAAEILAGAIQDHDMGVILGTTTWGKGLVQTVYSLSYDSALALTTAEYYTPSGRLIQRDYSSYYDYYSRNDRSSESREPTIAGPGEQQVFFTALGREVRGGGGIKPDIEVEAEEAPKLLQFLNIRNAFFNFGVAYTAEHPVKDERWMPDDEVMVSFRKWLIDEELATEEELAELEDPGVHHQVEQRLRAEIFNYAFGIDAWYRVLAEDDNQIQAAFEAMDRAAEILERRQAELREAETARISEKSR